MNKYGKDIFWRDLKNLQPIDETDSFTDKHKDKLKVLFWVICISITAITLQAIAKELAMKIAGIK
ncbi:MAG: hypothetical protein EHM20_08330 [Alphaproteobacteria bacterium]|nr:MAG: hypothetical protein EHM20_12950 [Alphaproteobacteria bacterium]RPJ75825.1 MAG: hypothetical protein EHM20_08330 [Alphaproteobacteria bacterium]